MQVAAIQVHGGGEFRAEFEGECARLRRPPAGTPQLNGHVERTNGTARTKFSSQYAGDMTVTNANGELDACLDHNNNHRPLAAIGMVTPIEHFATLQHAA